MPNIEVLAEREARAGENKSKSEAAWRKAWWATTLALGEIDEADYRAVRNAAAVVRAKAGGTSSWVSRRARTGRVLVALGGNVSDLPPKVMVELVEHKIEVTPAILRKVRAAERAGTPFRQLVEDLSGQAWPDTPGGMSREAIRKVVAKQPEAVAREVIEHKPAREAAFQHQARVVRRETGIDLSGPKVDLELGFDPDFILDLESVRSRLTNLGRELRQLLDKADEKQKRHIRERVGKQVQYLADLMGTASVTVPDDLSGLEA